MWQLPGSAADINTVRQIAFYRPGRYQEVKVMAYGQELMLDIQFAFVFIDLKLRTLRVMP